MVNMQVEPTVSGYNVEILNYTTRIHLHMTKRHLV